MRRLRLSYKEVRFESVSLDIHRLAAPAYETWRRAADPITLPDTLLKPEALELALAMSPLPVVTGETTGAYSVLGSFHLYTIIMGLSPAKVTLAIVYGLEGKTRYSLSDRELALSAESALIVDSCARPDPAAVFTSLYRSVQTAPWKSLAPRRLSRRELAAHCGLRPERLRRRAAPAKPNIKDRLGE